jgi:hypothetical protein
MLRRAPRTRRRTRSFHAACMASLAVLSACASDANPDAPRPEPSITEEDLHWGDLGSSELEYIGNALSGAKRVTQLLRLARIPFRGNVGAQGGGIAFLVPESRAEEARAYLAKYGSGLFFPEG